MNLVFGVVRFLLLVNLFLWQQIRSIRVTSFKTFLLVLGSKSGMAKLDTSTPQLLGQRKQKGLFFFLRFTLSAMPAFYNHLLLLLWNRLPLVDTNLRKARNREHEQHSQQSSVSPGTRILTDFVKPHMVRQWLVTKTILPVDLSQNAMSFPG